VSEGGDVSELRPAFETRESMFVYWSVSSLEPIRNLRALFPTSCWCLLLLPSGMWMWTSYKDGIPTRLGAIRCATSRWVSRPSL